VATERRGPFDRAADRVEKIVSHAAFFAACVLLILLWLPLVIWLDVDTWQLIINTATTIITFLLLALLTNTQRRFEQRVDAGLQELAAKVESIESNQQDGGR
jgi:low affinity Fe/Cu permease